MEANEPLKQHLQELESLLHQRQIRTSAQALDALLADEFFELGVSGTIWTKPSVIEALREESFSERSIDEFKLTMLADDVALVTYRGHRHSTEQRAAANSLRSSIWKRIDGRWKMIFHQGTALP